jgi:ribosome biogenesis GTPase
MDLPGLREVQVWGGTAPADETFSDIDALTGECRFRDCLHEAEAGCAVLAAIAEGGLDRRRYDSYLKLRQELAHQETKVDEQAALESRRKQKRLHKQYRNIIKRGGAKPW